MAADDGRESASVPLAERMRADWDLRAAEDHRVYIATGHAGSEEEFLRSGERDLEDLVLDGIRLRPEASVLEIGCGVGRLLVPLARRVAEVRGFDISPVMIEKSRVYTSTCPNIRTEVTDGTLASVVDASLDFVFSFIVFQHVPALEPIRAYVAEAARVLKPGGVLRFQLDGRWWATAGTRDTYDGVKVSPAEARGLLAGTALSLVDEWGAEGHYHWITARKAGAGAVATVEPRGWDVPALASVLRRLGDGEAAGTAKRIREARASLHPVLADFANRHAEERADAFIDAAMSALFGRETDAAGRAFHAGILEAGHGNREALLDTMTSSREFLDLVRPFVGEMPWFAAYEVLARIPAPLRPANFIELVEEVTAALPERPAEAVEAAYRIVFGRLPEPAEREHHSSSITRRTDARRLLVRSLLAGRSEPAPAIRSDARLLPGEALSGDAQAARRLLEAGAADSDDAFVTRAYRRVLRRAPDAEGRAFYSGKLTRGEISRAGLLRELFRSEERRKTRGLLARVFQR